MWNRLYIKSTESSKIILHSDFNFARSTLNPAYTFDWTSLLLIAGFNQHMNFSLPRIVKRVWVGQRRGDTEKYEVKSQRRKREEKEDERERGLRKKKHVEEEADRAVFICEN